LGCDSSFPFLRVVLFVGVRSLCWRDYIISTGGGSGRISFYDIRYSQYLDLGCDSRNQSKPRVPYLQTGQGHLVCFDMWRFLIYI
jgi:hypothetical protein